MLVLTTIPHLEGKRLVRTLGLVTGTAVRFDLAIRNSLRFRDRPLAEALRETSDEAIQEALRQMEERAGALGADAVVDVRLATCAAPFEGGVLMVSAVGTAVACEDD
jgi:uncharacterized protein YbjQ (UPF0145 family)